FSEMRSRPVTASFTSFSAPRICASFTSLLPMAVLASSLLVAELLPLDLQVVPVVLLLGDPVGHAAADAHAGLPELAELVRVVRHERHRRDAQVPQDRRGDLVAAQVRGAAQ